VTERTQRRENECRERERREEKEAGRGKGKMEGREVEIYQQTTNTFLHLRGHSRFCSLCLAPFGGGGYSYSMIPQRDSGRLRLSQRASLKPDESEGCSPVSSGRTIRLRLSWPSDDPPTPLRSSVDTGTGDRGGAPPSLQLDVLVVRVLKCYIT
jgi:hypothetical protein